MCAVLRDGWYRWSGEVCIIAGDATLIVCSKFRSCCVASLILCGVVLFGVSTWDICLCSIVVDGVAWLGRATGALFEVGVKQSRTSNLSQKIK